MNSFSFEGCKGANETDVRCLTELTAREALVRVFPRHSNSFSRDPHSYIYVTSRTTYFVFEAVPVD